MMPDEILTLVSDVAAMKELYVVATTYFSAQPPLKFRPGADILGRLAKAERIDRYYFILRDPGHVVKALDDALAKNSDCLVLNPGKLHKRVLEESQMSTMTKKARCLRAWREAARALKERTKAGVWAADPRTGAAAFYRTTRYSAGVAAAVKRNLQLKSLGRPLIYLEKPATTR